MAKQNRGTLKNYFKKGALPTEKHFSELIDSNLNMVDEGFAKSPEKGFEISLIGDNKRLISFFESSITQDAVWTIDYDKGQKRLLIKHPVSGSNESAAMVFAENGNVGVNTETPNQTLDIAGVVASQGRIGSNYAIGANSPTNANGHAKNTVPADGTWQKITGTLTGCHAFEIMAGVGKEGAGKYAMLNAFAMNTFNPPGWFSKFRSRKKPIKCHQAYYHSRCDRIELRWCPSKDKPSEYHLEMRTGCDYGKTAGGEKIRIRYYITQLWFDPLMQESWKQDQAGKNETQD